MSMIQSDLLLGQEGGGGYTISRSLRFNSSDSGFLSRVPSTAGNRRTWTWAGWVKRSAFPTGGYNAGAQELFTAYSASNDAGSTEILFLDNQLTVNGWSGTWRKTTAVYRDPSAWYHVVVALDTTQATASNRLKIYVNGTQVTDFATSTDPSQNADLGINNTSAHAIGRWSFTSPLGYFDGLLADIWFVDSQALTPSAFGEFDATTGVWNPKAYSGPALTGNSFHLDFADNSAATATALGKDTSGNGNNWTPNNLSVTAGAGNDSLVDSPTNYGTDTGAGGEVRGNYCTLNPLAGKSSVTLANGNLERTGGSNNKMGTFGMSSGKWYWEIVCNTLTGGAYNGITEYSNEPDAYDLNYMYNATGAKFIGTTTSSYGASYAVGDVVGFAYDADAGSLTCYKNGVSQGVLVSGLAGKTLFPVTRTDSSAQMVCNFGQRPFAYTAPSGFKALCTTNLPTPTIANGATAMDVKLYTGNGSTQTISGLNFSPDLVWLKSRSQAVGHFWYDQIRGAGKFISSDSTNAEADFISTLSGFTSDGFSLGSNAGVNNNTSTYVAWTWDAGSSTVTNTQGSISSQVRANPGAGFSIVTYTGNGTNPGATIGHGLGVTPGLIITKARSASSTWWPSYHSALPISNTLYLNSTVSSTTYVNRFSAVSSTTFTTGSSGSELNDSGVTYVAYCFAPVAGYSAFGSYTGNGSADGPFVFCNFRPRWVMVKATAGVTEWVIFDTSRLGYNARNAVLLPSNAAAEQDLSLIDLTSNGFKLRAADATINPSGVNIIYAAFAESPFAYSRAR